MNKRKIKMEVNNSYINHIANVRIVDIENIQNLQIFKKLLKKLQIHKKRGCYYTNYIFLKCRHVHMPARWLAYII